MAADWQSSMVSTEEADGFSAALLVAGSFTCFFAYKFSKTFVILIGGVLFGLFMWNEVVPQFGEQRSYATLRSYSSAWIVPFYAGTVDVFCEK